jgi:N-acetylmuramoyl-L-alanine amidase
VRRLRRVAPILALVAMLAACGSGRGHESSAERRAPAPAEVALPTSSVHAASAKEPQGGPADDRHQIPRPRIVWKPIPYGSKRKAEMADYSERHYGEHNYRLIDPQVIVEHYTANESFSATYNTFASDNPDPELHELPNVCSQFVVDKDGTIYQLVKLGLMCRHTVGLNYTAIGIEHVGNSDSEILNNHRQLSASLKLTRWLRCTKGIFVKDVIGHNESLGSPYHKERVASLRHQTHGDWTHSDMKVYRSKLRKLGGC